MVKMLSATAVAHIPGDTTFTIAELIGPVEANRHSSAATMAGQYTAGRGDDSASKVSGAASRVAPPDTHKYACRERSEEHTSELQSQSNLVCRLLLEKKKNF